MNEGQYEALQQVLRGAAAFGLFGAAGRTGIEMLRQTNPRYEPPKQAPPTIVTIPRPVAAEVPALPAPSKAKELHAKAASFESALKSLPGGETLYDAIPQAQPWFGPEGATQRTEIPARMFAMPLAVGAGAGLGYFGADRLLRAADRRRAKADLAAAQQEFQDATIGQARSLAFPGKFAADVSAIIDDEAPGASVSKRIKAAIDRAYAASQSISSVTGIPPVTGVPAPPKPASTATPGTSASATSQPAPIAATSIPKPEAGPPAIEKISEDEWSQGAKSLQSLLFPYSVIPGVPPETSRSLLGAGLFAAGTGAGIGGYLGYQHSRDAEKAQMARKAVKDVDKANASEIPSPLIARIVPYQMPVS